MITAGDVVVADVPGATGVKRRPAVVLSSDSYHAQRPDVILGLITSNVAAATASTDHVIQDWHAARLHRPSAFRAFLVTRVQASVQVIGRLSDRDWQAVRECARRAMAIS
jgi:mRNA interferase MazF